MLDNHAPIVSSLKLGVIAITTENKDNLNLSVSSGFIEVLDNKVSLLVQENKLEEVAAAE